MASHHPIMVNEPIFSKTRLTLVSLVLICLSNLLPWVAASTEAQEDSQFAYWQELSEADRSFSNRSDQIGRTQAFLEFLGDDSVVFRDGSS